MSYRRVGAALAVLGAVTLSACGLFGGGKEAQKLVCPGSFVAPDADKLAMFRPGGEATLENVLYGVRVTNIASRCVRADKGLTVSSRVDFQLVANDSTVRTGSFTYFVSVVDAQQNILTKQVYSMPFEFDPRHRNLDEHEELVEQLPLVNVATGGNYAIVVGLQLTPEQLQFNRAGSRSPAIAVQPRPNPSIPPSPLPPPKP
jgi:hypothetical protein